MPDNDNTEAVTLQRKFIQQQKVRDNFNKKYHKSSFRSNYPTTRSSEVINAAEDPGEANMIMYLKPKDQ